jgi:hypothetical protein
VKPGFSCQRCSCYKFTVVRNHDDCTFMQFCSYDCNLFAGFIPSITSTFCYRGLLLLWCTYVV